MGSVIVIVVSSPPHCLLLSEKTAEKSLAGGSSAQSLRFQNSFLSRIASVKLTILEQSSHTNQSPSPNPYEDNSTPLCSIQSTKLLPYLPLSSFSKTFPFGKQTSSGPQAYVQQSSIKFRSLLIPKPSLFVHTFSNVFSA